MQMQIESWRRERLHITNKGAVPVIQTCSSGNGYPFDGRFWKKNVTGVNTNGCEIVDCNPKYLWKTMDAVGFASEIQRLLTQHPFLHRRLPGKHQQPPTSQWNNHILLVLAQWKRLLRLLDNIHHRNRHHRRARCISILRWKWRKSQIWSRLMEIIMLAYAEILKKSHMGINS
jgi:hypothetical protein